MTKTYELPNDKMIMADVDEKHHMATVSVYALDNLVEAVNKAGICEEENPNCIECIYYDHEKHHCPRFCKVIEDTMVEITSEQPRWIPCSERLPKENEHIGDICKYYLIQDEYGDMYVAHLSNVGWIPITSLKAIGDEVVAWMPLPEPYGGEEE